MGLSSPHVATHRTMCSLLARRLLASAGTTPVLAEEKPLWEAGLGVGALSFPDYRGADERNLYPVPVPYFVYRGDFFKADRDGMRGRLFDRERVELSVSIGGTIPVRGENDGARAGMPDLEPTLELGPSLDVHVWRSGDLQLDIVLPVRAPITIESSPKLIGWVFAPRVNLDIDDIGGKGWKFGIGAGPIFATERYHEYFYEVEPGYATADRPAYETEGGYSGLYLLTALSKRFPKYWIGAYLRYDLLSGAVFDDSPLVRQEHSVAGGIGIAWMIGKSKRMVESED